VRSQFREKWIKQRGADPVSWGRLDRQALEAAAVGTLCGDTPQALQGAFTTGYIPRQSFERVLENTLVESETGANLSTDHFIEGNGRDVSYQTSIRTNTRPAISFGDAGSSSSLRAAMSD